MIWLRSERYLSISFLCQTTCVLLDQYKCPLRHIACALSDMRPSLESPARDLLIRARAATLSEPPIRVTIIADEAISRLWISATRRKSTHRHCYPTAAHVGCLPGLGHGKQSDITTGNTRGHLPYMCSTKFFLSSHTGEVATVKADRWSMNIPSLQDVGNEVGQQCSGATKGV